MCGSTAAQGAALDQQSALTQQQSEFYSQLQQQYSTVFGEDQGILQNLTANITPIINAGPSQQGFSAGETNSLNTQATEQTGAGYAQAKQAMQEDQAAAGGGNNYLPSGGDAELQGQLASSAEGQLASQKNQINLADYQQGATNYNNAVSGEETVAGMLNPAGFAGATTGAGSATSSTAAGVANTANQIAEQGNSVWTSVIGALGGVAGAAAGNFSVPGGGSSSGAFDSTEQASQSANYTSLSSSMGL